jgi:Arc/MetJ-type ribon-helix-helix transcriptional regulator
MNGMKEPKVKVAVSLSPELVARMRSEVGSGRAASVSAFVEHAVRSQLAAEAEFDDIVEEMLAASGGAPTEAERAEAARLLGSSVA